MNKTHKTGLILLVSLTGLFFGGCATNSSPLEPYPQSASASQGTALNLVGTGAGAYVGSQLAGEENKGLGAAIGAGGGYLATSLWQKRKNKADARTTAEAYHQGRRDSRVEVMQDYWKSETLSPDDNDSSGEKDPGDREIYYPAGTYDGIKFSPRKSSDDTLEDPLR